MIRVELPSYGGYLIAGAMSLVLGVALVIAVWGRHDRLHSHAAARTLMRELGPILVCFVFVVITCIFVAFAYSQRLSEPLDHSTSILGEFLAALLEDIVFFFTLGLVVYVVQRRAHERARPLEDRVDLLFNARRLSNRELDDLKNRVHTIACDYRLNECVIEILDYDAGNRCVLLDVARRWEVQSHLRAEYAEFDWKLKLKPDPVPGKAPLLEIYPITMQEFRLQRSRWWWRSARREPATEVEHLHAGKSMDAPEEFRWTPRRIRVSPGRIRELRSRYRGWQRLIVPETGEPDTWNFDSMKHWHMSTLRIRNSLDLRVQMHVTGAINRHCVIPPRSDEARLLSIEDMPPGSRISIQFEPL